MHESIFNVLIHEQYKKKIHAKIISPRPTNKNKTRKINNQLNLVQPEISLVDSPYCHGGHNV